jgi:hypothetical protein
MANVCWHISALLPQSIMAAIGIIADVSRRLAPVASGARDPSVLFDDRFCCDAQEPSHFRISLDTLKAPAGERKSFRSCAATASRTD